MHAARKVPVSERAVLARVNRKLAQEGRRVRKARPATPASEGSPYYMIDERRNFMAARDLDLEQLAKKLGVLRAWEELSALELTAD